MRLTNWFALIAMLGTCSVSAQTIVTTTKPLTAGWRATDFASFEVRLTGRKATDALTANRIIGRIALKTLDFSLLTQRITILVPANETWEVKGMTMHFVPVNTTGIRTFDIPLIDFATPFHPPSGQVLAIDVDVKTGNVMMGPVTVVVVPPVVVPPPPPPPVPTPVVANKPGDSVPPLAQLVDIGGAVWTFAPPKVFRNGIDMNNQYLDATRLYISQNNSVRVDSPSHGYICLGIPAGTGC